MSLYKAEKAIFDYLSENWTYTPIREVNKDRKKPVPYIEMYFKPGKVFALEIKHAGLRTGVIIINIFTPKGVGTQQGAAYGGKLEDLFWHKDIDGVVCENDGMLPYTSFIGIDEALQACHHQTIIPFNIIKE